MKARTTTFAFTLMELLVVIGIIIILAAIMVPAVNALTKGSAQKQSVNTISVYLAAARTQAIAEGRQVGVVFFEDPQNTNQTAMQICVERNNKITASGIAFTTFSAENTRVQYLPRGVKVATLNDGANVGWAGNASASNRTRAIIFDNQGQIVLRNGLCFDTLGSYASGTTYKLGDIADDGSGNYYLSLQESNVGNTPVSSPNYWRAITGWHFDADYSTPSNESNGTSAPGLFVFDFDEFQNNTTSDADRTTWLQSHADVLIINPNTGAVIR